MLLMLYSALNPLAYCGGLIFKIINQGVTFFIKKFRKNPIQRNGVVISEYGAMRSYGITLSGPDPLRIQLQELDAQSRIMMGLGQQIVSL